MESQSLNFMITRSENECYHCHSRCIKLPYFLMILIIYWLPERVPKAPPTTTTAKNAKPQQHSKQAFISINDNFNNFNNNHKSFDFHNRINGKYKFYFTFCWARHIIINSLKYFNTFHVHILSWNISPAHVLSLCIYIDNLSCETWRERLIRCDMVSLSVLCSLEFDQVVFFLLSFMIKRETNMKNIQDK